MTKIKLDNGQTKELRDFIAEQLLTVEGSSIKTSFYRLIDLNIKLIELMIKKDVIATDDIKEIFK